MSELVERVALIIEASVERHGGGGLVGTMDDARAAIAEVMDWLAEAPRDKLAYDSLPDALFSRFNQVQCLVAHRHILSAMRKEALGG